MKRLFKILLLSFGALLPVTVSQAEESVRLRVLSYNIHHAEGVDRKLDLKGMRYVQTVTVVRIR